MEETALKQPAMVSRLPKFGSRGPAAGSVPSGSCGGTKGLPPGKQNGVVRLPPSLSLKGKKGKEDGGEKVPDTGEDVRAPLRSQPPARSAIAVREIRKPSATLVGKASRPSSTAVGPGPRTPPQSSRANPRATAPRAPFPTPPLGTSRTGVNGVSVKPGTASTLPSLSQSNDSLRTRPLENVARSHSFSYLKSPAPTSPALTRSYSFNRAAELAKELPRPLAQSPLARSPVALASERAGAFGFVKPALAPTGGYPFPPASLKKSLLPSCTGSKPSALSYRLMRPSLIKQPRPLLAGKVQVKTELTQREASFESTAPPPSEPSSTTESAGTTPEEPSSARESEGCHGQALEVPEDMSLSSTSSLERNDVSEEYMDDFDDLGNGVGTLLLPARGRGQAGLCDDDNALVSQYQEGSSITSLHSFLSETVDWAEMGLTGSREAVGPSPRHESEALSASGDAPHGSSLDLSPSDSSGGTYMWDEEVLEPLQAVPHGSYDSDLNSMDILNNLENLESCDLEDDDLMLDVDLPEDTSLHSDVDGMCHYEHSERGYWPGPWRRRPQCWGLQDKLHDDNRSDDGHMCLGRRDSGSGSLNEMMLKHMTQDCSFVKEQLLQLRRLLQAEDGCVDDVGEFTASPSSEDSSCQQQVEELLKEVQILREEVRGKDRLITQLTLQMSTPMDVIQCQCGQESPKTPGHQDKGTQTPWRVQTPQILQSAPESPSRPRELEMLPRQDPTGAPSECVDTEPGDSPMRSRAPVLPASSINNAVVPSAISAPDAAMPPSSPRDSDPDELSLHQMGDSRSVEGRVPRRGRPRPNNAYPQSFAFVFRKATLQAPRPAARFSLSRDSVGGASLRPDSASPSGSRHLPPPTQGLPCISSAPQAATPTARQPSSGRARELPRACFSRLPTPKSH